MSNNSNKPLNLELILPNVRLSYPSLWKPKQFASQRGQSSGAPRFQATFLLSKTGQAELVKKVWAAIDDVEKSAFDTVGLKDDKLPFHDGDELRDPQEAYAGHMYLASARAEVNGPPVVVSSAKDRDGRFIRLDGSEGLIYAGCYVNAVVRIWAQNASKFGVDRINCSLENVQFYGDGLPLTQSAPSDPNKAFAGMEGKGSERDFRDGVPNDGRPNRDDARSDRAESRPQSSHQAETRTDGGRSVGRSSDSPRSGRGDVRSDGPPDEISRLVG